MSVNQHWRKAWIKIVYAHTVKLFHEARKEPENAEVALADLARQCANSVFAANTDNIVGDKELCAREFMRHCRENIGYEIGKALAEQEPEQKQEYVA